jgi:hypothetical protein
MMIPFGPVARKQLGMQAQYAHHYLSDPELGKGVRWEGDPNNYHFITIHSEDVEAFVERVTAHRRARGEIR